MKTEMYKQWMKLKSESSYKRQRTAVQTESKSCSSRRTPEDPKVGNSRCEMFFCGTAQNVSKRGCLLIQEIICTVFFPEYTRENKEIFEQCITE